MSSKPQLPELTDLKPRLVVIGIGGAGCNAVNNMIAACLTGVEFVVANTDAQALAASSAEYRIQLGATLTEGLGAGSKPEIGQAAAEEALEEIRKHVTGAHMVFIAAGMGGGTGTGAAATIARVARDLGILTVGVVTKPFQFEGTRRLRIAEAGIAELKPNVDTLIVIPNQNLFRLANEKTTFSDAFILADQVLYSGVACIVDLIIKEGLINLDFADVRTVISGMGSAMMGTGEAEGERRAILAAEEAIANPLLDDVSLTGARGLLLSITGGPGLTLYEVDEAASRVREEVDPEANIIVGATHDQSLGDRVRVSIVASGMNKPGANVQPDLAWEASATLPPTAQPPEVPATPALFADPHATPDSVAAQDAAPSLGSDDTMQQRLSEVLQNASSVDHGAPPSGAYSDDHVDTWSGGGDVTIEDGLPPLPEHSAAPVSYETPAGAAPQDFQPAATEQLPRSTRRMPVVEDFPPHAQMEYRHKQSYQGADQVYPDNDSFAEPARKPTLLDRLKRRARRKSDSFVDNTDMPVDAHAQSDSQVNDRVEQRGDSVHCGSPEDQETRHQEADLPMFFGRMAK